MQWWLTVRPLAKEPNSVSSCTIRALAAEGKVSTVLALSKALLVGLIGGGVTFLVVALLGAGEPGNGYLAAGLPAAVLVAATLTLFTYLRQRSQ